MATVPGTMAYAADPLVVGGLATAWEAHAMSDGTETPDGSHISCRTGEGCERRQRENVMVHIEEQRTFLAGFLGEPVGVLPEMVADKIYIDVLIFPPSPDRPIWTFVTCGMSDLPMRVPNDVEPREQFERAELAIALPAAWFAADERGMIPDAELEVMGKYWPISLMKVLARFPHQCDDWLWSGHTVVADGSPLQPYYENTRMCGSIVLPLTSWPEDKHTFKTKDGRIINFFAVVPLHADEITLKLNKGSQALCDALDDAGYNEVLFVSRPSVVRKKSPFGFFKR
jgi:hypothetical protein